MRLNLRAILLLALLPILGRKAECADGVFVRMQLVEPAETNWYVKLGGYIHNDPWHLPETKWPAGAEKDVAKRVGAGQSSPWFDLGAHAGKRLHGRLKRAGGVAEFPNVTIEFVGGGTSSLHRAVIELATAPEEAAIVKRLQERFEGKSTSFLISPNLQADADSLETASQMTARRLAWAREASGGGRVAPTNLWVQTQFWSPQRPELNVQEAEVLWLLGFNLVGGARDEMLAKFPFLEPAGHHWTEFGPELTREDIEKQIVGPASKAHPPAKPAMHKKSGRLDATDREPTPASEEIHGALPSSTLFGFSDEIACRPPIGTNPISLAHFHDWLKSKSLRPADLGVALLDEVVPIESPPALRERQKLDRATANRVFVWTTRFRHESATQRLKWLTESFHDHAPSNVLTTTLVADHPYFGGSGLGMGMDQPNTTWGSSPLSLDWFGLARERVVDVIGIEDWLGLNFMYGPQSTWEGFQLIGFQANIFRSASRGQWPIITWITPSDETNLRLKSASALCQGAKHFFYWTYGPTATSTENYWSDLRGAYDGIVSITRQLAGAEHIIAPGRTRAARVALLYSLSSDLWQPFGYLGMLERRLTYFSLIHEQYLVDMLTERDVEENRLRDYDVLYVADPCVSAASCAAIREWVQRGGQLYGSCAAASRNEFNEEQPGLTEVFGVSPQIEVEVQRGRFDLRGALNDLPWLDQIKSATSGKTIGALGIKAKVTPKSAKAIRVFTDGSPAVLTNSFGKGHALWVATCPGTSYAKDAHFVSTALKEKWPSPQRDLINSVARASGTARLVELSEPVVEAGIFDAPAGTALVLANFAYNPISELAIRIPMKKTTKNVRSLEKGPLKFKSEPAPENLAGQGYREVVDCTVQLGLEDIIVFE